MRTSHLSSLVILALTGSLMLSCSDRDHDNKVGKTTQKPKDTPTETVKPAEATREANAEVDYKVVRVERDSSSLIATLKIKNSKGEFESLKSVGARNFVTSGSQTYDFFEAGKGEAKAVALLRNDTARLSMAFVVTTEKTINEWNTNENALTKDFYDDIYVFDHAPTNKLNGTFKAKLEMKDLLIAAETVGITGAEMVEALRVAIIESTTRMTAEEILDTVKKSFQQTQEGTLATEDTEPTDEATATQG